MFPNQFLAVKNMLRKTEEYLLMKLPTCTSRAIPLHVPCNSVAHGMCTVRVIPVHATYAHPMRFPCMRPV